MDRTAHITERFTAHFKRIGATPVVLTREQWAKGVREQTNLRVSLGFRRPEPPDRVARFCPELVAAQSEHLTDDDFHAYLDALQWTVDFESEQLDLDLDRATEAADAALAQLRPGSLRLMSAVHMAWLDRDQA